MGQNWIYKPNTERREAIMRSSQNIDFPLSVWKQSHYSAKPLISFVSPQYDPRLEIRVRTLDSGKAERENPRKGFFMFFCLKLSFHDKYFGLFVGSLLFCEKSSRDCWLSFVRSHHCLKWAEVTLKYSEYIIPGPDRIHKICQSYPQQEQGRQGIYGNSPEIFSKAEWKQRNISIQKQSPGSMT